MPGAIITKRLPSFEGVAPSSMATLRIPPGFTYHDILLTYANALTDLSEIRVVANGIVFQRFTGTQLDALNRFYGDAAASGAIWIHFDRQGLRIRDSAQITAVGMGPRSDANPSAIDTFSIEVDLSTTASPALSAVARISQASPAGVLRKIRQFSHAVGSTGEFQIADFPKGDAILASHHLSSGISSLILEKNSFIIHDRTKAENDQILADGVFGRVPQTNYYHFDPAEAGYGNQLLVTSDASDLRYRFTMGTAVDIATMLETMGPLSG